MSISCEAYGCKSNADLQCTCEKKYEACGKHFKAHSRICKKSAISTEELLAEQMLKIVEADKCLENLKDQIGKQSQELIFKITKMCTSIISDISTKQNNLKKMKLGRKWDSKEFYSVQDLRVIESQRIKFCNIVKEISEDHQIEERKGNIDFGQIEIRDRAFFARRTRHFQVAIHKGIYMNHPVAIKMYQLISPEATFQEIENEIKCYQTLSDMSTANNCFIKYYGSYSEGDSLNLVMDFYEKDLMRVITEKEKQSNTINEQTLGIIFRKLLQSYAEMAEVGIFHGDIKPHNILTDDYWNMKIIDFDVAVFKNSEFDIETMGANPVQGTIGYLAPELEALVAHRKNTGIFSPEKADVFSLGLCFLQLLTMRRLENLNTFSSNAQLMRIVDSLQYEWAKELLRSMLAANYHERPRFKQCFRYLDQLQLTLT